MDYRVIMLLRHCEHREAIHVVRGCHELLRGARNDGVE